MLRLRLPAEVKVSESKCQRSKTNGALLIVMPKVNPKENAISIRGDQKAAAAREAAMKASVLHGGGSSSGSGGVNHARGGSKTAIAANAAAAATRTTYKPRKLSVMEQMLLDAQQANDAAGAATPADGGGSHSGALLDSNIGAKRGVNVRNIVPKKNIVEASEPVVSSVFNATNGVVELD